MYQERESVAGAAAVILTGGKSSRMGRPKALLAFGGEPLIVHVVRRLETSFKEIIVVAAAGQELPPLRALIVRDELPFKGPVAGIFYGLQASAADFAFVTSCDAPFLNLELVRFLTSRITDWDVVVPYWEERFQPLHAVYRTKVASLLAQQLERDELRPITLYERVRTLKISGEEIRRFDPAGLSFMNMNTPEDYQAALELWNTTGNGEIGRQGKGETRGEGIASCTVELFGLARLLTKAREITLHLAQPARLADVYHALGEKYPVLLGRVIDGDARSLTRGYACNINGLDFARDNDVSVNPGDRIFIISADAGG